MNSRTKSRHVRESGFSILEMVIVLAVAGVLATLAVAQQRAQTSMRVTTSRQLLAQYLEKARLDSKRRRAATVAEMASVRITSNDRYLVTLDFRGTGTPQTREIVLPDGIRFNFTQPVTIRFDERGLPSAGANISLRGGYYNNAPPLVVSDRGNIATGSEAYNLPTAPVVTVNATNITGTTNIDTKLRLP